MLFGNVVGPLNDDLARDFDGTTTRAAQEVMVVLLGALQIDRLAVLARQDVHLAGVHHESQSPVDRTESSVVPAPSQHGMDLLGAAEIAELREQISDSLAIASSPELRADPLSRALVHGSEEPGRPGSGPRPLLCYQQFPSPADANTGTQTPDCCKSELPMTAAWFNGNSHLSLIWHHSRDRHGALGPGPVCVRGVQTEVELV